MTDKTDMTDIPSTELTEIEGGYAPFDGGCIPLPFPKSDEPPLFVPFGLP